MPDSFLDLYKLQLTEDPFGAEFLRTASEDLPEECRLPDLTGEIPTLITINGSVPTLTPHIDITVPVVPSPYFNPNGSGGNLNTAPPQSCEDKGYSTDECDSSFGATSQGISISLFTGDMDVNGDPIYADKTCYSCECQACSISINFDISPTTLIGDDFGGDNLEFVEAIAKTITVYLYTENPDVQNTTSGPDFKGLTPRYSTKEFSVSGNAATFTFSNVWCNQTYYYAIETMLPLVISGSDPESNEANTVSTDNCGTTTTDNPRTLIYQDGVDAYYVVINGELRKTILGSTKPWKLTST